MSVKIFELKAMAASVLSAYENADLIKEIHLLQEDGAQCSTCNKPTDTAERVEVQGQFYHPTCFKCAECSRVLKLVSCVFNQQCFDT
ncbi:hypothetical protein P879_03810 [Paragonimus westermani]|uniref:LIM zinc-binding domain-containing protein n=1 Tax=Paragonimus westermani TaxID=34504 RepID=A0A8T0DFK4_9TREM|nr:hypothetical protein P879_03810 [Paragonimus westermani]